MCNTMEIKKEGQMKLYTLFISYSFGGHYCGVYPSLKILRDVIKEMMKDMEIKMSESPSIKHIQDALAVKDDFWHEFSDSTWIHVQETSEQNNERIFAAARGLEYA